MKKLFLLVLMIVPVMANSQTFTLPTYILDSLLWEAERGRSCDSLRVAQARLIESQGLELIEVNKALKLSMNESKTLSALVTNAKESNEILTMQFQKDIKQERKKTRKWKGLAILEAVGFIGILLLL